MSDRIAVFNGGRIEQLAVPAELYEHPASAFVAGFVGTSNLLEGEIAATILGTSGLFTVRPEKIQLQLATPSPNRGCVRRPESSVRWCIWARRPSAWSTWTPAARSSCCSRTRRDPSRTSSNFGVPRSGSPGTANTPSQSAVSLDNLRPEPTSAPFFFLPYNSRPEPRRFR